ncbi:MAG: diguanylate cyclase [Gallionellaceae bacterium]|jgi:two-component system cell cycle response regulator
MNVLIVEPSRTVAFTLSTLFGKYGFESRVARSGQEALEMLKGNRIDLLCFTFELGDMDGIEFFVSAKAHKLVHHQPGLMFSSTPRKSVINRALMAGVTECFAKRHLAQLELFVERFAASHQVCINGKVLLVEDSMSSAMFYRQVLERMGLQIEHCKSAEEAIVKISAGERFDLVVTDYILAGAQTGFSVIRAVRESFGKKALTPILAISSFDDIARKVEILRNGANDFVGKPVVAEELEVRVFNMLKMQKLMSRLESQHEVMKDIAMRDTLTSLYNRYHLNEISPRLIAEAHESGQSLSLMVIDADHFKEINDTHGHKTGDEVLQQIAKALQGICRSDDLLARIGGEEFVVILPNIGLAEATARGAATRARIESLNPCGISVTASIGVAALHKGETYDELFQRADSAMYRAKTEGRNRVVTAE